MNLEIFKNNEFGEIRILTTDNEPWFVGKDIAEALGYSKSRNAISAHVDKEDKKGAPIQGDLGGLQEMTIINESGLYSLVLSSKLPTAKKFKRWVTSEVLPAIRKHGAYMTDETVEKAITDPDFLIQLATNLKEEKAKRALAEAENERNKPKVLFATSVEGSENSCLIGELAKLISQNGYDIGQNRLFSWMRENGYLIKRRGESYNSPTQYSMDLGLMEVKKRAINNPDGSVRTTSTTKVTGKGQIYFVNKFVAGRE